MTATDDLFDLESVRTLATVVKEPDGDEHLMLSDGFRHLQLRVTGLVAVLVALWGLVLRLIQWMMLLRLRLLRL